MTSGEPTDGQRPARKAAPRKAAAAKKTTAPMKRAATKKPEGSRRPTVKEWEGIRERIEEAAEANEAATKTLEATLRTREPRTAVRLTRQRTFAVWCGKGERLTRLVEESQQALDRLQKSPADAAGRLFYTDTTVIQVEVTGSAGQIKRTGPMDLILAEIDAGEIESVHIHNEARFAGERYGLPEVDISFGKHEYRSISGAVKVQVSGEDKQWVGGTYDALVSAIQKGVPWWSFLRHPAMSGLLGGLLFVGLYLAVALPMPRHVRDDWLPSIALASGVAAVALEYAFRRLVLRPFEVLEPGRRSTFGRFGAGFVVVLGLLFGGISVVQGFVN